MLTRSPEIIGPDVSSWDRTQIADLDHTVCSQILMQADDGFSLKSAQDEMALRQMRRSTPHGVIGSDWEYIRTENDIEVYSKPLQNTSLRSMKASTVIPIPTEELLSLLWTTEFRLLYDDLLDRYVEISNFGDDMRIQRLQFRSPVVFVRSRDFCVLQGKHSFKNNIHVITSHSVTHTNCPPTREYIRGLFEHTGFVISADTEDNTQSRLTFIVNMNPRGLMPNWATNIGYNYQMMTIARFRAWACVKANGTIAFKTTAPSRSWKMTRVIRHGDDEDESPSSRSGVYAIRTRHQNSE
eukprot:TRINITY_DN10305_c0_g1_i1.p1 TRINITY_DN10305_c0_g1~~TRINITY_DN10305_c0_g1_i1.p1  ORF type:complete len:297 (-),score=46.31 TRINITY_DN10305_c0_g1_i1:814-1704(-)